MKSFVDVYLSVFYPAAVGKPKNYIIGNSASRRKTIAKQNKGFDINNNQQITIAEIEQVLFNKMPQLKKTEVKKNNIFKYVAITTVATSVFLFVRYKRTKVNF